MTRGRSRASPSAGSGQRGRGAAGTRRARRVLLVHYTTPAVQGGVEQVMGAHAVALRAAGAAVTILAGRGGAAPKGVRVVRVPEVDSRAASIERDLAALRRGERTRAHEALAARLYARIRPLVAAADRVVVHNVLTMPMNLALTEAIARAAAELPGRVIAWTHDIARFDPRYDDMRHAGEPWDLVARALDGVRYVAVSAVRADQLSRLLGLERERVSVVTNGLDVTATLGLSKAAADLVADLDLLAADPLLLLPARITRRKRIEAAIDATAALRARGRNAMVVITGGVGPHDARNRAYLADLAARAKKVPGVHLLAALGVRLEYEAVADLFALADVLVLPSESEGFGIPMLEAGLHRLPIVCSDLGSLRETGGADATYVPPDADGARIADAVERAIDTPVGRMRQRALAHAWPRVLRERVLPVILEDAP